MRAPIHRRMRDIRLKLDRSADLNTTLSTGNRPASNHLEALSEPQQEKLFKE